MTGWQPPSPIHSRFSPREILAEDFPSLRGGLPIQGGWGYTQQDACIICKDDPLVDPDIPFYGVGIEYAFVEKRNYEELIIFQLEGKKHSGIKSELQEQSLIYSDDVRKYDHLIFEMTCFTDADWEMLKTEWEDPNGAKAQRFDFDAHDRKRHALMKRYTRDFWFDITSFFGED